MDGSEKEAQIPEGLRRRKVIEKKSELTKNESEHASTTEDKNSKLPSPKKLENGTYWLTRILILRYLGFIYFVAFLVALHQNKQLLGLNGLLPAQRYLNSVKAGTNGVKFETFTSVPTILWFFDYETYLDDLLDYIAYGGLALASFVVITGGANWFILLALWVLYHSLVNIGDRWYSFGWESQTLETGFLAIFLCPLLSLSSVPRFTPTSKIGIFAYRWLIFRIMLGAGLIKIRGDKCWLNLTCMNYHYETQPVPNPMSYYMHQEPEFMHKFETLSNHFIELVAPFFLIYPRRLVMIGGGIQILFQVVLIISGNLSFLNWLTILPSLACFDDASIAWMFSKSTINKVLHIQTEEKEGKGPELKVGNYIRRVFNICLALLIAYLSIPVVQNLISPRQRMNTSFEPLRLVNTYGAFGRYHHTFMVPSILLSSLSPGVTKERTEVIYQGTYDDPKDPKAVWEEYEFKCKPDPGPVPYLRGEATGRGAVACPIHNYQYNPWIITLAVKLLANDVNTTSLIAYNPFEGRDPPKYVRVEHYSYKFTKIGSVDAKAGRWWKRHHIDNYLPPLSIKTARPIIKSMNLRMPTIKKKKKKTKS